MEQRTRQEVDSGLFRSSLLSSDAWLRKANDLLSAATLLEPQVRAVWKSRLEGMPANPVSAASGLVVVTRKVGVSDKDFDQVVAQLRKSDPENMGRS